MRVLFFDQLKLPTAIPFLDLFLSENGRFEPDQPMGSTALGEPIGEAISVFPDAANEVVGHPYIKRSITFAGQKINVVTHL